VLKSGCHWGKSATMVVTFPISALDQAYYPEARVLLSPGARKYPLQGYKKSLFESLWVALDADAVKDIYVSISWQVMEESSGCVVVSWGMMGSIAYPDVRIIADFAASCLIAPPGNARG
jgi:hypothetical protein